MRPWLVLVLTAVVVAGLATAMASNEPFETRLIRLESQRALPSIDATLQDESLEINALFLSYASDQALWMSASLAILRYGDVAREMLLEYGYLPAFQDVLKRYGADAILPVHYFYRHDVATLRARHWIGERYQAVRRWWLEEVEAASAEFTPHRRGLIAIALLDDTGHGLLNQFEVSQSGEVQWLQSERVVTFVGDFFTSGLRDLESLWRRGEDIGAGDLGWAGVDLLLMAGAVKLLRAGKAARPLGPVGVPATGTLAGGRFATLPRMAKIAAVAGTAYVVVRHPSLVSALGANLSRWLGLPIWIGQFLVWLIVLLPLLIVVRFVHRWLILPLLWLLMPLLRPLVGTFTRSPGMRAASEQSTAGLRSPGSPEG